MRRAAATVALCGVVSLGTMHAGPSHAADPPRTGFETADGARWTTHAEELAFLAAVDAASPRVAVDVIGRSVRGRPLHLVRIGDPAPATPSARMAELHICTQHGNEPAGREGCLQWIRDLATTTDPVLLRQLRDTVLLFVPTVNPDGRAANVRENANGVDINRDHLNVTSPEARIVEQVVRDWRPALNIDHHEYGPSIPALYDDDVLYLWPRNLNVDQAVHDLARSFALDHLRPCLSGAGFTSDEYGLAAAGDLDLQQTAGDGDEGISRNTAGLRHGIGILAESATTTDPKRAIELLDPAANQRRRVRSHHAVIGCTLAFARANVGRLTSVTTGARARKAAEGAARSAPVFFDGQDEDRTVTGSGSAGPTVVADPPPCGYALTEQQRRAIAGVLEIHGVVTRRDGARTIVDMGQEAEPLIPLLLDARGTRHAVNGTALEECPPAAAAVESAPPAELPPTGRATPHVAALALAAAAALRRRPEGSRASRRALRRRRSGSPGRGPATPPASGPPTGVGAPASVA